MTAEVAFDSNISADPGPGSEVIHMEDLRQVSVDEEYNSIVVNPKPSYRRRSVYQRKPKRQVPIDDNPIYENLAKESYNRL